MIDHGAKIDLVSSVETHKINNLIEFSNIAERILAHDYDFEVDTDAASASDAWYE